MSDSSVDDVNPRNGEKDDHLSLSLPIIWNEDEVCNRRLSRAARSLLEETLRQTVLLSDPLIHDSDDIWTLLEHWLPREARPAECPLFPSLDILRQEEEQWSIPIQPSNTLKGAYPQLTLKERRKASPKRPQRWWKCGICSKVFSNRYYMDLHLKTRHNMDEKVMMGVTSASSSSSSVSTIDSMLVCPADDWCRMLGEANCNQQALQDEPFYDRGSGGWSKDDNQFMIQHRFSKLAQSIPCEVESLRANCRQILDSCRIEEEDTSRVCDSLACPAHSHYFWQDAAASSMMIPEDWRSIWNYETQHHRSGTIIGIFLCLLICVWVYYMTMVDPFSTTKRSKNNSLDPAGKRLSLQKSSTSRATTTTSSRKATLDPYQFRRRHRASVARKFD
jgi:hypothetical protein